MLRHKSIDSYPALTRLRPLDEVMRERAMENSALEQIGGVKINRFQGTLWRDRVLAIGTETRTREAQTAEMR